MDIRYLKGIIILFCGKKKFPRRPAMSNLSIAPYFPFPHIRLTHQYYFSQFFPPHRRVTQRFAQYVHELSKVMTVKDVSTHVGLNWKTVKDIEKIFLEQQYGQPSYEGLRILAVDEISIRKGYRFLTIVLNYLTGRVVW